MADPSFSRYKRTFSLAVLLSVMVFIGSLQYMRSSKTFKPLAVHQNTSSKWLIFDNGAGDVCSKLKLRFPDWTIFLTGSAFSINSGLCEYLKQNQQIPKEQTIQVALKYAIEEGARTIYLPEYPFSEGVVPSRPVGTWREKRTLLYKHPNSTQNALYDPQFSWGCGPLGTKTSNCSAIYYICNGVKVGIETVVSRSPYLRPRDAPMVTSCDSSSASMVLESGMYALFPSKGVVFNEEAFWALPVVFTSDVQLKIIAQKLLWLSGHFVRVRTGPVITSCPLPSDSVALNVVLNNYKCQEIDTHLDKCIRKLITTLHTDKIIQGRLSSIVMEWLLYLDEQMYQYPCIALSDKADCSKRKLLKYFGNKPDLQTLNNKRKLTITNEIISQHSHKTLCANESVTYPNMSHPGMPVWNDVLLVITFNNNFYKPILYLELLYRKMFPHILYCVPTGSPTPDEDDAVRNLDLTFAFYHENTDDNLPGTFFHECVVLAAMMRLDVRGYLIIADDVLIFPKQLHNYDKDATWFLPLKNHFVGNYEARTSTLIGDQSEKPLDAFTPFKKYEGETKAAMAKIRNMTSNNARECVHRLTNITGTANRPLATFSDALYIPANKIDAAAEILDVFVPTTFVETAIPTAVQCIAEPSEYVDLRSIYLTAWPAFRLPGGLPKKVYYTKREDIWEYINPGNINNNDVIHPYKLSHVHKREPKHVHFFCRYLEYLYHPDSVFDL